MNSKMDAVVLTRPGEFEFRLVEIPEPGDNEVLCRVRAVAICGSDPKIISGISAGKWPPKYPFIIGHEWAGEVVGLGRNVTELRIGDRVAGQAHSGCGVCKSCLAGNYNLCVNYGRPETGHRHYGHLSSGAYAQYNIFTAKSLSLLPDSVSYQEGALVDTAGTGLHALNLAGVKPGGTIAIIGPGPIGLIAAKIAATLGYSKIIMIGRGHRLKAAQELCGCDAIHFEKEDPVARIKAITQGMGVDTVIECSGAQGTFAQAVDMTARGGSVSLVGIPGQNYLEPVPFAKIVLDQIAVFGSRANPNVSSTIINLLVSGKLVIKDLITHKLPLSEFETGLNIFTQRRDGVLKVVLEP